MNTPIQNPFDLLRAADFTDLQILDYWVDFAGQGGLRALLEPSAATNKLLLGGKGSGKTHLLRYCSYPVQKLRNRGDWEAQRKEGYIGVFLRANTLDTGRFSGKGIATDLWGPAFNYYFELRLCETLLSAVADITDVPTEALRPVLQGANALFDVEVFPPQESIPNLLTQIVALRKKIDLAVNNCAYTRSLDVKVCASPGSLVFGLSKLLCGQDGPFRGMQVLYLIDEVENLTVDQQRFLNTLLRHREGPCSFRLGARLYGIRTRKLFGSEEENREGSEYRQVYLDQLMRANSDYEAFIRRLCARRLRQFSPRFRDANEDRVAKEIDEYFSVPPRANWFQAATLELVGKGPPKSRRYFEVLRRELTETSAAGHLLPPNKSEGAEEIISRLQCEPFPLLEKLNVFLLYQEWARQKRLLPASQEISRQCREFMKGEKVTSYQTAYGHFALDMLAQLYRQYKKPCLPIYCGFQAFVQMSAGIPRNALLILQNVFKWASFNGEHPFGPSQISTQSQWEALVETSNFFFEEDARPGAEVPDVKNAVGRIAEILRSVRYASKPVEVSPSAFSYDPERLSAEAQTVLGLSENWSYLYEIPRGRPNRNSQRIDKKYQLNPMLAPKWELPIALRGDLPIPIELLNAALDTRDSEGYEKLLHIYVERYCAPYFGKDGANSKTSQLLLDDARE